MENFMMPGNPRYQPLSLVEFFGYDHLVRPMIELELALLDSLAEVKIIPAKLLKSLSPVTRQSLLRITTTEIDEQERKTRHDVKALTDVMMERLPSDAEGLKPWIHFSATSFDIRDSAMILLYRRSYEEVVRRTLKTVLVLMVEKVERYAKTPQIGRTHGKHAMPITAGFWLATILARWLDCALRLNEKADSLVGKFTGIVGAYNAQLLFGLTKQGISPTFEERVLRKVGLEPALISTQILPPEPLDDFLHAYVLLSGALAQFARDCRHLMRSEIGEVREQFTGKQTGSSTAPHKRNPITYENIEGIHILVRNAYQNVLANLNSEHQRDLVGSSVSRQFPEIVVLTQYQLEQTLKVIQTMEIDETALQKNLAQEKHIFMSEALQLALRQAGFEGDAHAFINHEVVPKATPSKPIHQVILEMHKLDAIRERIPIHVWHALENPLSYTGRAEQKALEVAHATQEYLERDSISI